MTNKKPTVDDLYLAICQAARSNNQPNRAEIIPNAWQALGAGQDLVALKAFNYAGVDLVPGMAARLGGARWDKQLVEQGYFCSESDWDRIQAWEAASGAHAQALPVMDELTEKRAARAAALANAQALAGEIEAIEAQARELLELALNRIQAESSPA